MFAVDWPPYTISLSIAFAIVVVLASAGRLGLELSRGLGSFATYWHARNIQKGPSSFVHSLHVRKAQKLVRLGKNEFSITDPELIKTIYADKDFVKSDQYAAFDFNGQSSIFSLRDPEEHARRAKSVRGIFKGSEVSRRTTALKDHVVRLMASLDPGLGVTTEVDLLGAMRGYSVQSISFFTFQETYLPDQSPLEVGKEFGLVLDDINRGSRFGRSTAWVVTQYDALRCRLASVFPGLEARELRSGEELANLKSAMEHYSDYCTKVANDFHNDSEYKTQLSLLDLSPAVLETEIADLLFAGTDSTATTLSTALWHIYASPQILDRLRDDLTYVDDTQLAHRPYLSAIIDEALRIAQPVPRRLPRVVPKDKDIFYAEDKHGDDWHKIMPAGSVVGISAYSLHRDPVYKDPESFDPDRWLTTTDRVTRDRMRDCFVPFGRGVRACMGQELARTELRLVIRAFVEKFDGTAIGLRPEYIDNFNATIEGGRVMLAIRTRTK